jgi:hypothetical protein
VSFRPPTFGSPVRNHEMPRLAPGLARRTHRVRPSEKTAHRAISGPFSARPSRLGSAPAEGRAPHARRRAPANRNVSFWPPAFRSNPSGGIMNAPACVPPVCRGRAERVPPRKPPFASSPGLPPQGHLALARPPEGRAPHARKCEALANRMLSLRPPAYS